MSKESTPVTPPKKLSCKVDNPTIEACCVK
jgi:hypothetical protein